MKNFIYVFNAICACAVLVAIIAPTLVRARSRGGGLSVCKSNLKCIGAALEMYSKQHQGEYPSSLQSLVPKYLGAIPECPQPKNDTYSESYKQVFFRRDNIRCSEHNPEHEDKRCEARRSVLNAALGKEKREFAELSIEPICPSSRKSYLFDLGFRHYQLHCRGEHHQNRQLPANYPQYNGVSGLIER